MNDELEHLFTMYDGGHLNRRQLLQGLLGLGLGTGFVNPRSDASASGGLRSPLFRAHTINHVTIQAADVSRSKAFYQSLTGLAVRAEDKDSCEFRLEHGFLGLYALEAGERAGYDHFCFGVDAFDAPRALAVLKSAMPEAQPTLESGDQVFLRDPDGVRVQLADVKYKR
jgi:catechol 2,3-dioxygenase-like lactoylglutathione lyase family enzyme